MELLNFPIQYVIYAYMYISVILLVFNILYIFRSERRKKRSIRRKEKWKEKISEVYEVLDDSEQTPKKEVHISTNKLKRLGFLISYCDALEELEAEKKIDLQKYLESEARTFRELAYHYAKRESMEKAYYAWFLSRFHLVKDTDNEVLNLLFEYLDNSTIYCRENVLKAIYSAGNANAVESTFQFFYDRGLYHSSKLLSDGLLTFPGNQEALARILWRHNREWNSEMVCAVLQFMMRMKNLIGLEADCLETLLDKGANLEVRIALVRYFARFRYEPARKYLQEFAMESDAIELAIVSAFALKSYPGEDSMDVLRKAVCSTNWYVRSNAASSLIGLSKDISELESILNGPDQYAREMLAYQLNKQS